MRHELEITLDQYGIKIGSADYGMFTGRAWLEGEDDEYLQPDEVTAIELETEERVDGLWVTRTVTLKANSDSEESRVLFRLLSKTILADQRFIDDFADSLIEHQRDAA